MKTITNTELSQQIYRFLEDRKGVKYTAYEIGEELGFTAQKIRATIFDMMHKGKIFSEGTERSKNMAVGYWIPVFKTVEFKPLKPRKDMMLAEQRCAEVYDPNRQHFNLTSNVVEFKRVEK